MFDHLSCESIRVYVVVGASIIAACSCSSNNQECLQNELNGTVKTIKNVLKRFKRVKQRFKIILKRSESFVGITTTCNDV